MVSSRTLGAVPDPAALLTGVADGARMPVVWAEDSDQLLIRSALQGVPDAPVVRFAQDGADAVRQAQLADPRLIVLDVHMPGVDGLQALRRLKEDARLAPVPVVMFSSDAAKAPACRALGAHAFVPKPLQYDEFTRAVRGIVRLAAS